jgi:Integrase core domain
MEQIARNVTMEGCGALRDCRYLLHDRDTKYAQSFRAIIASGQVEPLVLPARSPNLNAYAERWVRSVKDECLSKVILFGERSLRRALNEYVDHYHAERNHQGKGNVLLFPRDRNVHPGRPVQCRERLGGPCVITIGKQREKGEATLREPMGSQTYNSRTCRDFYRRRAGNRAHGLKQKNGSKCA